MERVCEFQIVADSAEISTPRRLLFCLNVLSGTELRAWVIGRGVHLPSLVVGPRGAPAIFFYSNGSIVLSY